MVEFYIKEGNRLLPVKMEKLITKDWADCLITVIVGGRNSDPPSKEADALHDFLENNSTASSLGAEFIVSEYDLRFEVLEKKSEIKNKYIAIQNNEASSDDNWMKLMKKNFYGKVKDVAAIPGPLTVEEYKQLLEIKRRCDLRRQRRG
jgi:hypothetical protein